MNKLGVNGFGAAADAQRPPTAAELAESSDETLGRKRQGKR